MHGNTKTLHPKIRGVQCVRRRLSDGTSKFHFYFRATGTPLPKPDHPDFSKAYEAAKRAFEQERHKQRQATGGVRVANSDEQSASDADALEILEGKEPPLYLTPEEVSLRWRRKVDVETLKNWRSLKVGPAFHRFGRAVLYRSDLLELWEEQNLVVTGAEHKD